MKSVSGYLQGTVQSVQILLGTSKETNGPEGTVASKTIRSVNMINQGLARLQSNIAKINPELTVTPEALLTVKVESLLAVSHFKHQICKQLHYARDFETTTLESAKRMTQWSSFYFTHPTLYYPAPSTQIHFQDFPRMTQQNLPVMSSAHQDLMRNWANTHSKCIRQCTIRQETTKYKAGTLPLNMYQTAIHRGEWLEFAPVERVEPEFLKEEGRKGAPTSGDPGDDQLSEYDDNSSDNDSDNFGVEEDGATRDMQNEELGCLFASCRMQREGIVKKQTRLCFGRNFSK